MEYYTGLVLLYFIFWLVIRLYRWAVDFTWWPIKRHDKDAINGDMKYIGALSFSVKRI